MWRIHTFREQGRLYDIEPMHQLYAFLRCEIKLMYLVRHSCYKQCDFDV